jgi:hypothetical protein
MTEHFPNESLPTPEKERELRTCADVLMAGKTVCLIIPDPSSIDDTLTQLKIFAENSRYRTQRENITFITFDFREKTSSEIDKEIGSIYPTIGPKFRTEHPGEIFIMIEPSDDGKTPLFGVRLILKWAPTLLVQTKPIREYPRSVLAMAGEYSFATYRI